MIEPVKRPPKILYIEDSFPDQKTMQKAFGSTAELRCVYTECEFIECVRNEIFDFIVVDFFLAGSTNGLNLVQLMRDKIGDAMVIFLTGMDAEYVSRTIASDSVKTYKIVEKTHFAEVKKLVSGGM